jgi:hypothetical protein
MGKKKKKCNFSYLTFIFILLFLLFYIFLHISHQALFLIHSKEFLTFILISFIKMFPIKYA